MVSLDHFRIGQSHGLAGKNGLPQCLGLRLALGFRNQGDRRGDRRNGERRGYGDRRPYNNNNGERRSYNNNRTEGGNR